QTMSCTKDADGTSGTPSHKVKQAPHGIASAPQHCSPGTAIQTRSLSPASTAPAGMPKFVDDSSDEKPAAINDEVRHIWIAPELKNAPFIIRAAIDKKNIIRLQENDLGDIEAELHISKKQLVTLVRKCHSAGFSLLSPTQPQPEQSLFSGNGDDKVKYLAVFTKN
ncbi:MAG: hypothetical protein JW808_12135, partial [Victivallales bacterium]|nr:hypothetical protein [Victivallales bacterium]